ncbi:MAG: hypothetical protein ACI9VR_002028 [Cognaticolwellia sp.]|jgi:hypothetical protein
MSALILVALLGCSEPRSIQGVDVACEDSAGISDVANIWQVLDRLDPECAEALAAPVGLVLPGGAAGRA